MKFCIGLLVFLGSLSCLAGDFENQHFSVLVPNGFEEPIETSGQGAVVYVLRKPHAGTTKASLFQVTVFELSDSLQDLSEEELSLLRDEYLKQFLVGVARRRDVFSSGEIMDARIGTSAARSIKWNGIASGDAVTGHMYLAIVDRKVVVVHIQEWGMYAAQLMPILEKMVSVTKLKRTPTD